MRRGVRGDFRTPLALLAVGAVVAAAVAGIVRARDLHVRRCRDGLARIYVVRDDDGEPVRVLNVGGAYQSATRLGERWAEPAFEYYRAFDRMFEANVSSDGGSVSSGDALDGDGGLTEAFSIRDVLMIGGGGCSYPKHALMSHDDIRIDVVEKDPAIARIARDFFFVDRLEKVLEARGEGHRFRLVVDDGLKYLERGERLYDVVIDDAFSGDAADYALVSEAGLGVVKSRLRRDGLLLLNVVADDSLQDAMRLQETIAVLRRGFRFVHVIDATDEQFGGKSNYLVVATDGAHAFSDVIPW